MGTVAWGKCSSSRVGFIVAVLVLFGQHILEFNPASAAVPRTSAAPSTPYGPDNPPVGMSSGSWRSILRQLADAEFEAAPVSAEASSTTWRLTNRPHAFEARFGTRGMSVGPRGGDATNWSWGLALVGFGPAGATVPVVPAEPLAAGNRVEYRRPGLTEWYVNDRRGVEQGFTILEPPAESAARFELLLELSGNVTASAGADGVTLRDAEGITVLGYGGLHAFDAAGRALPAQMDLAAATGGARLLRIEIDIAGAAFPVVVDPLISTEVQKLTAADAAADHRFGESVSISGDTVVVGAPYSASGSGSAYVFERNAGGADDWGEVRKLTATDAASGDQFGFSVSISGDTVVVGAVGNGDAGQESGSAYVFERNAGGADNWGQVQKLTAADAAAEDWFGYTVSIDRDLVIVGAGRNDDAGQDSGSAYVFERNAGGADNWGQIKKLTAADAATDDYFGASVSISTDAVVVGAQGNDDAGSASGSAYVFERNAGGADNWGQVRKLTAVDAATDDSLGASVSISGDMVVVGALGNDDAGSASGSAYVFERNAGGADNWGQIKKLTAADAAMDDYFGVSISISGDTVMVGATGDDDAGSRSGSAYVFERNAGGADNWGQIKKLTAADAAAEDWFGWSVSISGDTVAVGAFLDDDADVDSGSAYTFTVAGCEWNEIAKPVATDAAFHDFLGAPVAVSGDTVVVGASGNDDAGSNSGSAYVFERNAGGADDWGEVRKLTAADAGSGDNFGYSVSISGDTVVVGAPLDDDVGLDFGSAYVFMRNAGGLDNWGQVRKLIAADAAGQDQFGFSVSISGDTIVVGAIYDDDTASGSGSAYVFERNAGGADNWGQVQKLTAADAAAFDFFGWSVSISGDTVVVGAEGNDDAGAQSGSAYVFERNAGGADDWGQVQKLIAADAAALDEFGASVSIGGDTVVVGAYQDDDAGSASGSAYLFKRNAGGWDNWGQVRKLIATDAAALDEFGASVSIDGDTVVVGARKDDDAGSNSGSAYVFERNSGGTDNWGQVRKLTAADAAALDQFGYSVSISGDTVVVGVPYDDDASEDSGSAYVFNFACPVCGDGLLEIPENCDDTGESATCDGDCTFRSCGDSTLNVTAGETCDDGGESATCDANCTAAVCGDGTWNVSADEVCDDGNTSGGDACPADCGVIPSQVIAVVPQDNALRVHRGANVTVIFSEPVDPPTVTASSFRLLGPGGAAVPANVGLAPDGITATLDPVSTLASGAVFTVEVTSGVVDLVGKPAVPFTSRFETRLGGPGTPLAGVSSQAVLPAPPPAPPSARSALLGSVGANLGYSVASAGDLDDDGLGDFMGGAPGYSPSGAVESGVVAIYFGSDAPEPPSGNHPREVAEIIFSGEAAHDRAGSSVASGFDFDGDGFEDFLIGAEQVDRTQEPAVATGAGKVYLILFRPLEYDRAPVDGVPDYVVDPEMFVSLSEVGVTISGMVFTGMGNGDQAGYAVAGGGQLGGDALDEIVIGAPGWSNDAGRVYVIFSHPALCGGTFGTPAFCGVKNLSDVGGSISGRVYRGQISSAERLGTSVALPGDVIDTPGPDLVMGAPFADTTATDAGKVYVVAGGSLTNGPQVNVATIATQIHGDQPGEQLGFSVAGGGNNLAPADLDLLIGAPYYDAPSSPDAGRVVQTSGRLPASTIPLSQVGTVEPGVIWRGTQADGHLGWSVARLGDVSRNDELEDIGLGAPDVNPGVAGAGAVYVMEGSTANASFMGTLDASLVGQSVSGEIFLGEQLNERAGLVMGAAGDLDGDTTESAPNDFTVGSPGWLQAEGTVHQVLESILQPEGNCTGLTGCRVADLLTGALLDVPPGSLGTRARFQVRGLVNPPTACSATSLAGWTLVGTSDNTRIDCGSPPCTAPGFALPPDIEVPTRAEVEYQLVDAEGLLLRYCDGPSGWTALSVGPQTGTVQDNSFLAGRKSARAEGVDSLHLYGVFFADADRDDVRASCDCLDTGVAGPTLWDRPGPVGNLQLSRVAGTTLTWAAPEDPGGTAAPRYDIVRSTSRQNFVTGVTCVEGNGTDTAAVDATQPNPGQVFYYLVVAQNDCPSDPACFDDGLPAAFDCTGP